MPKGHPVRHEPLAAFRLDDILVEPDLNTVTREGKVIRIELKLMEALVVLASRPLELVTRRELIDTVWGTEYICDNTLTHAVSEIRSALGDNARDPSFIETIHRRGYRLLVPVTSLEDRPLTEPGRPAPFRVDFRDRSVQLKHGANLIGRAQEATIRIDSVWISRLHARITVDGGIVILEDLESRNGTYLNGERVTEAVRVTDGDSIALGRLVDSMRLVRADPRTATTDPLVEQTPLHPHLKS